MGADWDSPSKMLKYLILCCLAVTSYGQLIHHINSAVTPYYHANVVATGNHLATRGYYGYGRFYGKREAEADPQILTYAAIPYVYGAHPYLVAHPNGAVVPLEPADVVKARAEHLAATAAA